MLSIGDDYATAAHTAAAQLANEFDQPQRIRSAPQPPPKVISLAEKVYISTFPRIFCPPFERTDCHGSLAGKIIDVPGAEYSQTRWAVTPMWKPANFRESVKIATILREFTAGCRTEKDGRLSRRRVSSEAKLEVFQLARYGGMRQLEIDALLDTSISPVPRRGRSAKGRFARRDGVDSVKPQSNAVVCSTRGRSMNAEKPRLSSWQRTTSKSNAT